MANWIRIETLRSPLARAKRKIGSGAGRGRGGLLSLPAGRPPPSAFTLGKCVLASGVEFIES